MGSASRNRRPGSARKKGFSGPLVPARIGTPSQKQRQTLEVAPESLDVIAENMTLTGLAAQFAVK